MHIGVCIYSWQIGDVNYLFILCYTSPVDDAHKKEKGSVDMEFIAICVTA